MTDLTNPIYTDEEAARKHFEAVRWPDGPICPHCGTVNNAAELKGKSTRPGVYKCREKNCRKPFSATIGTLYERSHIPLHKWLLATHLLCSSKKGMSAHQLFRMLGFGSYRTAWFMAHRIREAMRPSGDLPPMGGLGSTVEVDETYIGREPGKDVKRGAQHKMKVVSLVERGSGRAQSFVVDNVDIQELEPILVENIRRESKLMTDEATVYQFLAVNFYGHMTVNHSAGEYVNADNDAIHTNTIEGYFSIFKRGMRGIYQHCGKQHLHRYLAEFDFRYTNREATGCNDADRAKHAITGAIGKRLTYQQPHQRAA